MERKERCDRCYWWVLEWPSSLAGECRLLPPKINDDGATGTRGDGQIISRCEYPATHADWFCSQFKPQEYA